MSRIYFFKHLCGPPKKTHLKPFLPASALSYRFFATLPYSLSATSRSHNTPSRSGTCCSPEVFFQSHLPGNWALGIPLGLLLRNRLGLGFGIVLGLGASRAGSCCRFLHKGRPGRCCRALHTCLSFWVFSLIALCCLRFFLFALNLISILIFLIGLLIFLVLLPLMQSLL